MAWLEEKVPTAKLTSLPSSPPSASKADKIGESENRSGPKGT